MNFKTTLLLLVLLAGVAGGYLVLRSSSTPSSVPTETPEAAPLVTGRAFQEIRIQRGDELITLTQEDGRWTQTQPVRFPARAEVADAMINAALALTPRQSFALDDGSENTVVSQPSADTTGLDQPDAVVTFTSDTGPHTLELGRTSIAGTAYLRTADDGSIHLVTPTLHRLISALKVEALWPEKLPTLPAPRISEIDLTQDNRVTLLRRGPEGWTLGDQADERADTQAADQLTALAQEIPIVRYVGAEAGRLGQYGLDEPAVVLSVADPVNHRQTLRVGGPADLGGQTLYATWSDTDAPSPVVFVTPASSIAALPTDPDALRDARVVTALPESIRGQHVNRVGRDSLEVALTDRRGASPTAKPSFAFAEPTPGYLPDPELAARWLTLLPSLEVQGFSRAPREAQAPVAIIELKLAGNRSEFVRLYADRDGRDNILLAVRENEAVAALVAMDAVAPLLAPVVTLRDRLLPTTAPLDTVQLQRDDGQGFVFTPTADGSWALQDREGDWEAVAFDRLRQWVETPRVAEWTALSELPRGPIARLSTGPDQPAYVVNVDQNLGQRTDLPGVFRLPPDIGPLMAYEYRSRMLLPYEADALRRVSVWSGSSAAISVTDPSAPPTAVLQRRDDGTLTDAQDTPRPDPQRWTPLLNNLAGLSAKRYFNPGPDESPADLRIVIETQAGKTHTLIHYEAGRWSFDDRTLFIDAQINDQLTDPAAAWQDATAE